MFYHFHMVINKRWRKLKGQSRMNNPETQATLGHKTQDKVKKKNN